MHQQEPLKIIIIEPIELPDDIPEFEQPEPVQITLRKEDSRKED